MAELVAILEGMRERQYNEHKFMAAMQGIDLDKETGRKSKTSPRREKRKKPSSFEDIQARVASGGLAKDADDILSLQGNYGAQKGFLIGKDMGYARIDHNDPNAPKSPLG